MTKTVTRLDELRAVVEALLDDFPILVAQVDPDAIGTAFGLKALVRIVRDLNMRIFYAGSFAHPQNRAMMNQFDLSTRMQRIDAPDTVISACALVDSSSVSDGRIARLGTIDPLIVIDHHQDSDIPDDGGRFIMIENVGAASTLMVELLRQIPEFSFDEESELALMLALGIYTDTHGLQSASPRDRVAYDVVRQFADDAGFMRIINYTIPESYYVHLARALSNATQVGSRLVTNIGIIKADEGDDLSTIADLLIRKNGVSLAIVWGSFDNVVRVSARSTDVTLPLTEFLRECFGERAGAKFTPDGRGEGGALLTLQPDWPFGGDMTPEALSLIQSRIEHDVFKN